MIFTKKQVEKVKYRESKEFKTLPYGEDSMDKNKWLIRGFKLHLREILKLNYFGTVLVHFPPKLLPMGKKAST